MHSSIYVLLALVILCVMLFVNLYSRKCFAHKSEFVECVLESPYFKMLSNKDLYYRGCNSVEEYLNKYINSYIPFSDEEKRYLVYQADIVKHMLPNKLSNIKYKFVKIKYDPTIENGYPHTIGNLIVLNDNFYRIYNKIGQQCTIVHEIIHIYQRMYPNDTDRMLSKLGFYKLIDIDYDYLHNNLLPDPVANPDCRPYTDYYIIVNGKRKAVRTIYALEDAYSNNNKYGGNVKNITIDLRDRTISVFDDYSDIKYNGQPNEVMAEIISKVLFNKDLDKDDAKHRLLQHLSIRWLYDAVEF